MRYKPKRTRLPALFLALSILLSMLPPFVLAAETDTTSGTSQNSTYGQTTGNCTCGGSYVNGFCTDCDGCQEPSKDANGVYEIASAGNLYWFAQYVNEGNSSINAKLTAYIVVNKNLLESLTFDEDGNVTNGDDFRMWDPIGFEQLPYEGTFDGGNHTISGLYYNYIDVRDVSVGLFGSIEGGANIKNVSIDDNYFCVSLFDGAYVGGIVGRAYASEHNITITGCCNTTGLTVNNDEKEPSYLAYVGGIVAYAETDKGGTIEITKCCNTGDLAGNVSYDDVYVGGIVAYVKADGGSVKFAECYNTGSLTANDIYGWAFAGGITSYVEVSNSASLSATECHNTGSLTATTGGGSKSEAVAYTGGIAAYAEALSSGSIDITVCYNEGKLTATSTGGRVYNESDYTSSGGIVGYAETYNALAITISNCYNIGNITSSDPDGACAGGIVGCAEALYEMTISNCFAAGKQYDEYDCSGVVVAFARGVTIKKCYCTTKEPLGPYKNEVRTDDVQGLCYFEQFIYEGDVTWWLNNESVNGVWKQTLGVDNYPNFTGEEVASDGGACYNPIHIWENGVCTDCGKKCTHNFGADGICTVCGVYCSCEPDENGVCTICKQPIAARITVGETISYRSNLNAAFAVASGKTATITLLCDTTLASTAEIDNSNTNITLIGGTYTVSAKCTMFKITAGTLTVKSGTYAASSGKKLDTEDPFNETYITTSSNVFEVTGGTLNIESGTYTTTLGNVVEVSGTVADSTTSSGSSGGDGLIYVPDIGTKPAVTTQGIVNISGGSFTSDDGYALYVGAVSVKDPLVVGKVVQGTANITGGNFVGSSYAVYVDKASDAGTMVGGFGKLNVSGGTFGKLYVNGAPNEEVVLTGGSFDGVEVKMSSKTDVPACAAVLGTGYGFFDGDGNGIKLTDVSGDKACTVKLCTSHGWDSATGKCHYCATSCAEHIWDSATGECTNCGFAHIHESWTEGVCDDCGYHCPHGSWESATCTVCGVGCTEHVWNSATGKCSVCGTSCAHGEKNDNGCAICGYAYQVGVTVKNAMMIGDEGTTTYYFTLEDAISAAVNISAKNNSLSSESIVASMKTVTVTLLSDLTLAGTIEIANSDADIILVGGEHTVTATDTIFRITGGSLTVQSGNFTTTGGNVFYVGGKVKIPESGIYIGATTETTTEGKLNISGGSFTSAGHTVYVTRVIESSESDETITVYTAKGGANISGGIFTSTDGYAVYDALDTVGGSVAGGDLSISGGSFNGGLYIGGLPAVKENTVTLSGGRFSRVSGFAVDSLGYYLPQYYAYFTADASGAYTIPTAAKSVGRNSVAVEIKLCTHIYTNADGVCDVCGKNCAHPTWDSATGACATCGYAHIHENYDEDGFCTVCRGGYQAPTLNSDGYYEIDNAGKLYWFAQQVNSGNTSINGKLTADIVVNENLLESLIFDEDGNVTNGDSFRMWTPIGYFESTQDCVGYHGTFDGANHTVSGLYYNGSAHSVGLFGYIEDGAHIKNVGVVDNYFCVSSNNNAYVGGVVGIAESYSTGKYIIEGCYHTGRIYVLSSNIFSKFVGGVLGLLKHNGEVKNCYNTGSVTGNGGSLDVGGVIGGIDTEDSVTVENCYNTGSVSGGGSDLGDIIGYIKVHHGGVVNVKNCYHLSSSANSAYNYNEPDESAYGHATFDNIFSKSAAEFASGVVAWLLNGSKSDGVWKQTLGTDTIPNFTGGTVYQVYACDGTISDSVYANSAGKKPPHVNANGTCSGCNQVLAVTVTVGETTDYYVTLTEAFAAASGKTATIKLLCDTTLTSTVEIGDSNTNITLIGGKYTVTASATMFKITAGTLTIESGNYTTTSGNVVEVSGTVADSTTSSGSSGGDGLIYVPDIGTKPAVTTQGIVNISGGSFTSKDGYALYVGAVSVKDPLVVGKVVQGTANITGGNFSGSSYAVYVDKASDGTISGGTGKLNVSGGRFGKLYIAGSGKGNVVLSGGIFAGISLATTPFPSQVLKSGYAIYTADASGEYTVLTAANTDVKDRAVEIKLCTHIYTNADGKCDACGNESGFKFAGYTLTLDGTIGMNFYTRFSDEFASSNNALIRFTIGGETIEFKPSDAKDGTHEGESYKVFTVPVCAYEMNLDITAEALLDGNVVATDKTSVRDYAEYIIAPDNGYEKKHIDFAVALLNYGAASQVQADRETNDLANKDLTDAQKSVRSLESDDLMEFKAENSTDATFGNFIGMNLVLYSETRLNVYFKLADGVDIDSVAFTVNGKTAEWKETEKGYRISISGIKAYDLDKNFTFTAKCDGETVTYECSAMTYCYNVLCRGIDKTYTQNLRDLISAMRVYNQKSEIYGGNNAE